MTPSSASSLLSFKLTTFALTFSFSLTTLVPSSSSYQNLPSLPKISPPKSSLSSSSPQNLAADILSLLGSAQQSSSVPAKEADEIRSCLRFLAPFQKLPEASRRELLAEKEDETVLWPPPPVMELARLAVDSGGDPAVIQRSLDPTVIKVNLVNALVFVLKLQSCPSYQKKKKGFFSGLD